MARPSKYDTATQERAVRMYFERLEDGDISQADAHREIGEPLGVKESTLRNSTVRSPVPKETGIASIPFSVRCAEVLLLLGV